MIGGKIIIGRKLGSLCKGTQSENASKNGPANHAKGREKDYFLRTFQRCTLVREKMSSLTRTVHIRVFSRVSRAVEWTCTGVLMNAQPCLAVTVTFSIEPVRIVLSRFLVGSCTPVAINADIGLFGICDNL